MKYTKKPVTIEAIQWDGLNLHEIIKFVGNSLTYRILDTAWVEMTIHTLEGDHKVSVGDYVIKGVAGEFYPCKPDIFEKTYDVSEN